MAASLWSSHRRDYAQFFGVLTLDVALFIGLSLTSPSFAGPKEGLTRALSLHFEIPTTVETFEFCRNGPTVTGIALPKYYNWILGTQANELSEGAGRVADENCEIVVTHFLSAPEILRNEGSVRDIFLQALVSSIIDRANLSSEQ